MSRKNHVKKNLKKEMKAHRKRKQDFDHTLPPSYLKKVLADPWNHD
jgi:Holliday junction resolvasome RuvABC ATP-dependent DNA helicase subunit